MFPCKPNPFNFAKTGIKYTEAYSPSIPFVWHFIHVLKCERMPCIGQKFCMSQNLITTEIKQNLAMKQAQEFFLIPKILCIKILSQLLFQALTQFPYTILSQ